MLHFTNFLYSLVFYRNFKDFQFVFFKIIFVFDMKDTKRREITHFLYQRNVNKNLILITLILVYDSRITLHYMYVSHYYFIYNKFKS